MILLEVYPPSIAIFELECNAPWPIYVDRIARRFEAAQGMEVKTGDIHLFRPNGDVQTIEAAQDTRVHLRVDLPGSPFLPKLGKTLAFEAPDHGPST